MIKYIDFNTGEEGVEVSLIHPNSLIKTASYDPELKEFLDSIEPSLGKYYLHINALGAGEYFSSNRNGDYFPEIALKEYYKTFETNANLYRHHKNKPQQGHKIYGKVIYSFYNKEMHRVELVVEFNTATAPDIKDRIDRGEHVPFSMGCFTGDTPVVMSDFSTKPIEQISLGDMVITHRGSYKRVTELHPRPYSGDLYTIQPKGQLRNPIRSTEEHPWLVIEPDIFYRKKYGNGRIVRNKDLKLSDAVWKTSSELTGEEFLVTPVPKLSAPIKISSEMAKISGWYLAEGHTGKNDNGVNFSVSKTDQIVSEIEKVSEKLKISKLHQRPHHESDKGWIINFYDKGIKEFLLKNFGKYSHKKFIHEDVRTWGREALLTFLGAYISRDGFYDKNKNTVYISSCNKNLLMQVRWLSSMLGMPSMLDCNVHKAGKGFSSEQTTEWVLRYRREANSVLKPYCNKIPSQYSINSKSLDKPTLYSYDELNLTKIDSISSEHYDGFVYNFEVEDDNSYVVDEWAVHNCRVKTDECSICGNKAKKVTDYCEHLRHKMNEILPDGRKVYAINRHPKFFDISFVTIPADKTAYMFSKVASDQSNQEDIDDKEIEALIEESEKKADIVKRIPGAKLESASEDPKQLIVDSQPEMPKDLISTLSGYDLAKVLSTFMALRIMPKRRDFQRLFLCSRGHKELSDQLDSRNAVFSVPRNINPVMPDDIRPNAFSDIVDEMYPFQNYLKRAPLTKPVIVVRVMEKMAGHQEGSLMEQELRIPDPSDRFKYETTEVSSNAPIKNPLLALTGLSGLYYGYASLMNKFKDAKPLEDILVKKPWLMPLIIGGASLASVKAQEHFSKQASYDPGALVRMLVAVPATYAYSGYQENKVQKGEPVSFYGETVRKHPLLMGVLHGWMAGKAGRLMDTMSKTAGVEQKLTDAFLELSDEKFDEIYQIVINT